MAYDAKNYDDIVQRGALIAEIMFLSYWVNSETEYCVFAEFAGHVDSFSVRITPSKADFTTEIASTDFYTRRDGDQAWKIVEIDFLKAKRDHLKSLLEGCEIEDLGLDEVTSFVTTYEF